MELDKIPVILILSLAVLLLLIFFLFGGTEEAKPPELPKAVVMLNEPDASTIEVGSVFREENGCEWSEIKVPIWVKYSAELNGGEKIDVVPFITFREHEIKAIIEGSTGPGMFSLTKERPEFSGSFRIEKVVTSDRPIRYGSIGNENEMKVGDKLLMEAKSNGINFTLKLDDLDYGKGGSISEILKNRNACGGTFEIECYNRQYNFDLFPEKDKCEESGLLESCQKVIPSICNSTVTIAGKGEGWCSTKTARVYFNAELGNMDKAFEVGERIGVTFLKEACAKDFDSLGSIQKLRQKCSSQDFLGTYYFTGGIVGGSGLAKDSQNQCI